VSDVTAHAPTRATGNVLGLMRSSAVLGGAVLATNLLNGLFAVVMVRTLEPRSFSLMNALFTVILMSGVPTLALQAGVARGMARRLAAGEEADASALLRKAMLLVLRWEGITIVVVAFAVYPLARLLHVENAAPAVATAAAIAVGVILPVGFGALQAQERFAALSGLQLLYAVLKFGGGIALAQAGFGVTGVMVGIFVATTATVGVAGWLLRETLALGRGLHAAADGARGLVGDSGLAAASLTLWTAAAYLDQIAARLALSHHSAGVLQAASAATRLVFAVPVIATTVLFPRVASLGDAVKEREHLLLGVRFVALFASIGTAAAFLIPDTLIKVLGPKYQGGAPLLGPLALTMSLFAVGYVYTVHFVALGRRGFTYVLGGVFLLEIALFVVAHGSPAEIVAGELVAAAVLVVCGELYDRARASSD
jgi:O-antigen/teichoic acid export membrane protein